MQVLIETNEGVLLTNTLQTYERRIIDPGFIIHHLFLSQLHLPNEKWFYTKENSPRIFLEIQEDMELMDCLSLHHLDVKQLVNPSRLFTYFLLENYLGRSNNYDGIGLFHKRKSHFLFLSSSIEMNQLGQGAFKMDDFGRYAIKNIKRLELQNALESFFVLIDEKLEHKLQLSLTQFVSSTGSNIDKGEWIQRALNAERLQLLNEFIRPYIY